MHSNFPRHFFRMANGKVSAQPHTTLCIQFLDRENNDKNNALPLGKQICCTIVWGCAEILPGKLLMKIVRSLIEFRYQSKGIFDDTFALVSDLAAATNFLSVLNDAHPAVNNSFPFAGMVINETDNRLNTCVCRRNTNKGLILHYQSHVDNRSKRLLIRTLIDCANHLSSSPDLSSKECQKSILSYTFCINPFHTSDEKLQHS